MIRFVFLICAAHLLMPLMACGAGTLAQFRTPFGDMTVELFAEDKPVTVENFIRYVKGGFYHDMFIHRCDPGFVIQGGGYFITNRTTMPLIMSVPKFGPITNEYNVGQRYSNEYGTLAMARRGGFTNSATSEWFFNLTNNAFLDSVDGGFTVFGKVVDGTNVLNEFRGFRPFSPTNTIVDLRAALGNAAFGELPVLSTNVDYNALIYCDIALLDAPVVLTINQQREISWNSLGGRVNDVEFTTGLPSVWQILIRTNGTGGTLTVTDPGAGDSRRFYRVRVEN
jgi:cyclophilin family peptidyl-prolyl cis-trans isomerase